MVDFDPEEETLDTMISGDLKVIQRKTGYRFSSEAVLLAFLVSQTPARTALEIGTGCGIISIILALYSRIARFRAIEIEPELYDLAKRNVRNNGLSGKISLILGDAREFDRWFSSGEFDVLFANPPYFRMECRRLPENREKRRARFEFDISLEDIAGIAASCLREGGGFFVAYRPERLDEAFEVMRRHSLHPRELCLVCQDAKSRASAVLIEGRKNVAGPLTILPPLYMDKIDVNRLFSKP